MIEKPKIGGETSRSRTGKLKHRVLSGAVVFVVFYLLLDVVHGALTTLPRPLPNAADAEVYRYLTQETAAVAANAAVLLCSAGGLLVFVLAIRRVLSIRAVTPVRRGHVFGLLAVVALVLSALLSLVLAAGASTMSSGTAASVQYAAFLTGGVLHVFCLGLFVGLTARAFESRGVRILSLVAVIPAVLSVISLVWFYGAALILLGRVLCMVWVITAAIVVARAPRVPS
ncbi:hypothetical protein [Pseudonocardia adelaidensis]|uniref:DUF4386 domain-containing protein n=1 Tax=Pseudonocardia adelaidensis TaxID=648754 RepID=A0ABP9NU78_9PSEU